MLGYLCIIVLIGLLAQRKSKSSSSFHGMGLGVMMCVAAGTGEWLGGTSTTGVSEYGFLYGISGAWYTIANAIGIIFLAVFFAKLYRSLETVTVPGIIEKFIGVKARVISSVFLTFVMIMVGTAQIIAAGTLGVAVLNLDYITSVIILGIGFIVYTLAGGMMAVGYTNTIHLIFMYGGIVLAIVLAGLNIGGLDAFKASLPTEPYFSMTSIGFSKISSWIIASMLGACTAQAGIQPILAARDVKVARKSAFITALAVAPFGILTASLGMIARVKYPQLTDGKLALPTLMMDLHPLAGGIVIASIMAAILSTVSPIILASGTMITKDIYQRIIKPNATDKQVLLTSRITTGISGLICMLLALAMYGNTKMLDLVYFAYSLRGALFVVLLLGIYWRRTTQRSAIWAMLLTAAVGIFWVAFKGRFGYYPISPYLTETYAAVITAFVSLVVLSLVFSNERENTYKSDTSTMDNAL